MKQVTKSQKKVKDLASDISRAVSISCSHGDVDTRLSNDLIIGRLLFCSRRISFLMLVGIRTTLIEKFCCYEPFEFIPNHQRIGI